MGQTGRQTVEAAAAGYGRLKLCETLPDVHHTQPSHTYTQQSSTHARVYHYQTIPDTHTNYMIY